MTFLVNDTQLVECPLLVRDVILYFLILKIVLGYQSMQAGGSLDGSELYGCHSIHAANPHPSLRASPPGHLVIYARFLYSCSAQLSNLLPRHPGLWSHHSYYSCEDPSALDSGYQYLHSEYTLVPAFAPWLLPVSVLG